MSPSTPPVSLKGLHLSWERITALLIVLAGSGVLWTVLGVGTKQDILEHNVSNTSHPIQLDDYTARPMPELVRNHEKVFRNLSVQLNETQTSLERVQNAVYDDRAERLADVAADKERDPQKSRQIWRQVKEKARLNLDSGLPIRHDLERYLE